MIAFIIASLLVLIVAAVVLLVTWVSSREHGTLRQSKLVDVCEAVNDLMNGDAQAGESLKALSR